MTTDPPVGFLDTAGKVFHDRYDGGYLADGIAALAEWAYARGRSDACEGDAIRRERDYIWEVARSLPQGSAVRAGMEEAVAILNERVPKEQR